MLSYSQKTTPKAYALWREANDTRSRSSLGGYYYVIAWILAWFLSPEPRAAVWQNLLITAFFGVLLGLRLLHKPPQSSNTTALKTWIDRHWLLIILSAAGWGAANVWLQNIDGASSIFSTLCTIAFSSVLAFNYSMQKRRSQLALLLLYVPGMFSILAHNHVPTPTLMVLFVYLSFLLLALQRCHRDYLNRLALEVKLIEQQAELKRIAHTDSLTQLGNRHLFTQLLKLSIASSRRSASPTTLVLLDIDYFKRVNDAHGHAVGDACLEAFALRMREVFRRDSDSLLRIGGEEFAVVMNDTTQEQAHKLAEQFRLSLTDTPLQAAGWVLSVTSSIGVGAFDSRCDNSAENFYKRIDDVLYKAKHCGRNRTMPA